MRDAEHYEEQAKLAWKDFGEAAAQVYATLAVAAAIAELAEQLGQLAEQLTGGAQAEASG